MSREVVSASSHSSTISSEQKLQLTKIPSTTKERRWYGGSGRSRRRCTCPDSCPKHAYKNKLRNILNTGAESVSRRIPLRANIFTRRSPLTQT